MRQLLTLICLVLLLSACNAVAGPAGEPHLSWELAVHGSVMVRPDNSLLLCSGQSFVNISTEGKTSSTDFKNPVESGPDNPALQELLQQQGMNQLIKVDNEHYLSSAGNMGWLVSGTAQQSVIGLSIPVGLDAGPSGNLSDNFDKCVVDGRSVVLYESQFAQAYDDLGQPLWQFAADSGSYLLSSTDGQRMLLASRNGSLYCLNVDGQAIWQQRGCFQTISMGDRLVMLDTHGNVVCLNWDGDELWQRGMAHADFTMLLSEPRSPLCVVRSDLELIALDREGTLVWQRTLTDKHNGTHFISPDGYVFIWRMDRSPRGGLLGQRLEGSTRHDSLWTCIDPSGNDLWRSTELPSHNGNFLPGYGGRLLVYVRKKGMLRCYDPAAAQASGFSSP